MRSIGPFCKPDTLQLGREMVNLDPIDHYCSSIQKVMEGGAKLTTPRGHEGLTTDMKGRWTIGAFDTKHKNKKETPPIQEEDEV